MKKDLERIIDELIALNDDLCKSKDNDALALLNKAISDLIDVENMI